MRITKAEFDDLEEIQKLQYAAFQGEALLCGNLNIPPLRQTLEELRAEFRRGVFLKAVDREGRIMGSVRGYVSEGTLFISKLMVHPSRQGEGLGPKLLAALEQACPAGRCELFTGALSRRNIRLYERLGYVIFREEEKADGLELVYLQKTIAK